MEVYRTYRHHGIAGSLGLRDLYNLNNGEPNAKVNGESNANWAYTGIKSRGPLGFWNWGLYDSDFRDCCLGTVEDLGFVTWKLAGLKGQGLLSRT